jgi:hypothetical protein
VCYITREKIEEGGYFSLLLEQARWVGFLGLYFLPLLSVAGRFMEEVAARCKYDRQVLESDVSKTNSHCLLRLCTLCSFFCFFFF